MKKRGQAGVEYMILLGFITFAIMAILVLSTFYSDQIKDKIRMNQVESFANQLVFSAEAVFFAGEPSKTTTNLYLPQGVTNVTIFTDYVYVSVITSSGENTRAYRSTVPLNGSIAPGEGIRKISLEAYENFVQVS